MGVINLDGLEAYPQGLLDAILGQFVGPHDQSRISRHIIWGTGCGELGIFSFTDRPLAKLPGKTSSM